VERLPRDCRNRTPISSGREPRNPPFQERAVVQPWESGRIKQEGRRRLDAGSGSIQGKARERPGRTILTTVQEASRHIRFAVIKYTLSADGGESPCLGFGVPTKVFGAEITADIEFKMDLRKRFEAIGVLFT